MSDPRPRSPSMPDLDEMLREYLLAERADPIRRRLENYAEWQAEHEAKDAARHTEVLLAMQSHNFRLSTLEKRADDADKKIEDTGNHHVVALEQKVQRVNSIVWDAFRVVLFLLVGGGVVEFVHRVVGH